jgi:hypothetical protein
MTQFAVLVNNGCLGGGVVAWRPWYGAKRRGRVLCQFNHWILLYPFTPLTFGNRLDLFYSSWTRMRMENKMTMHHY